MLNIVSLLPHCKKDSKVEAKSSKGATLNELIELKNSNSCLFFEVKFPSYLFLGLVFVPCSQICSFTVECLTQKSNLRNL